MHMIMNWLVVSDKNAFSYINTQLKNNVLDVIMPKITHLGGATITISSLLSILFFATSEVRMWAKEALISLAVSHLFVHIIKKIYGRKRPYMVLPNTRTFTNPLIDYSFPSGHTTSSFAIAVAFALHSIAFAIFLIPLAIIVGLSRMYLGLHYPTDVLFGGLLGSVTSITIYNIVTTFS